MGVTWDFSDVYKSIDDELNKLVNKLIYAGELAVQTAVQNGRYQNITGNLRSSIGYVLARDGKIIKEGGFNKVAGFGANMQRVRFTTISGKDVNFIARGKSGDGSEGSKQGLIYARQIVSTHKKGYTLVVVAGMDYASYVNARGFDVMDSAEIKVIELFNK